MSGYPELDGMSGDLGGACPGRDRCVDLVVAGALLHDIGKLTEFAHVDNQVCHSRNYQLLRHPLSGAVIAHEAGLPDELVHLIAVHSFEGEKSYQTVESNFVRKLDMFVFENSVWGLQKAKS